MAFSTLSFLTGTPVGAICCAWLTSRGRTTSIRRSASSPSDCLRRRWGLSPRKPGCETSPAGARARRRHMDHRWTL